MDNDFDSVSWQNEGESDFSRPNTAPSKHISKPSGNAEATTEQEQAGPYADPVDLAGVGSGRLDCNVDSPLKENDGTKDAYVSYLVTTHVCLRCPLALSKAIPLG